MYIYQKGRKADFGSVDQGSYKDEGDSEKESSGGLMDKMVQSVTGGLLGSDLCGCANKDEEAENKKKEELATKYPTRDCGPTPTSACIAYNTQQQKLRDAEFDAWKAAKDAQVADALPPAAKQNFAFAADLAKQMKALHPEAGGMTLAEIYKHYPDDFDKIYAQLQTKYPILKTLDPETALAMSPAIAGMTLDELIKKASQLGGVSGASSSGGGGALAIGGLGLLAIAGIFFLKKK